MKLYGAVILKDNREEIIVSSSREELDKTLSKRSGLPIEELSNWNGLILSPISNIRVYDTLNSKAEGAYVTGKYSEIMIGSNEEELESLKIEYFCHSFDKEYPEAKLVTNYNGDESFDDTWQDKFNSYTDETYDKIINAPIKIVNPPKIDLTP